MPHDPRLGDRMLVAGEPHVDEGVDDRVQLLLGRVPWLQQVVVEIDDVDRLDGGVCVGVRGEQRATGVGKQVHRFFEELEAAHLGHAMVCEQYGHGVAPQLELSKRVEGLRAGLRANHPIVVAVLAPEVPSDGARHPGVVVDGQEDWFAIGVGGHGASDGIPRYAPRSPDMQYTAHAPTCRTSPFVPPPASTLPARPSD